MYGVTVSCVYFRLKLALDTRRNNHFLFPSTLPWMQAFAVGFHAHHHLQASISIDVIDCKKYTAPSRVWVPFTQPRKYPRSSTLIFYSASTACPPLVFDFHWPGDGYNFHPCLDSSFSELAHMKQYGHISRQIHFGIAQHITMHCKNPRIRLFIFHSTQFAPKLTLSGD